MVPIGQERTPPLVVECRGSVVGSLLAGCRKVVPNVWPGGAAGYTFQPSRQRFTLDGHQQHGYDKGEQQPNRGLYGAGKLCPNRMS